jgi:hypothetical protein
MKSTGWPQEALTDAAFSAYEACEGMKSTCLPELKVHSVFRYALELQCEVHDIARAIAENDAARIEAWINRNPLPERTT